MRQVPDADQRFGAAVPGKRGVHPAPSDRQSASDVTSVPYEVLLSRGRTLVAALNDCGVPDFHSAVPDFAERQQFYAGRFGEVLRASNVDAGTGCDLTYISKNIGAVWQLSAPEEPDDAPPRFFAMLLLQWDEDPFAVLLMRD